MGLSKPTRWWGVAEEAEPHFRSEDYSFKELVTVGRLALPGIYLRLPSMKELADMVSTYEASNRSVPHRLRAAAT